jgi:hypothetical protein
VPLPCIQVEEDLVVSKPTTGEVARAWTRERRLWSAAVSLCPLPFSWEPAAAHAMGVAARRRDPGDRRSDEEEDGSGEGHPGFYFILVFLGG